MDTTTFQSKITEGYAFKGESIILGAAVLEGKPDQGMLSSGYPSQHSTATVSSPELQEQGKQKHCNYWPNN
jgi:hypothetical protein